jgi:hypothetical protein
MIQPNNGCEKMIEKADVVDHAVVVTTTTTATIFHHSKRS